MIFIDIKKETLIFVLEKMLSSKIIDVVLEKILKCKIIDATYETEQLHGGTLGDVNLLQGIAITEDKQEIPYKVVLKTQEKWDRPGDPDSWRREYDLYSSEFSKTFSDALSIPICYHSEILSDEIHLWMDYIEGVSGEDLTIEMLEQAAYQWGCFQGKCFTNSNELKDLAFLNDIGFLERDFDQWHRQTYSYESLISEECPIPSFMKQMLKDGDIQLIDGKSFEYSFLRSKGCHLPEHIKQMLIDIDNRKDEILKQIQSLPIVLCHRDF